MENVIKNTLGSILPGSLSRALTSPTAECTAQLQTLIDMACDRVVPEPDLAIGLEVCDFINATKKNTPREAAVAMLRYINGGVQHQAMLALHLLELCTKNCGYPFHLQLANKDFLNELVRCFPERVPMAYSAIQERILDLIQQWKVTIYDPAGKYQKDVAHVNDMYRLLEAKGRTTSYRFPRLRENDTKVMKASTVMKTKEELEKEDHEAQSAKLQELLRRGTPADLKIANDLMKQMTGFYHDRQPDYNKKADDELQNVQEKARLLLDVLRQLKPGEDVANHGTVQQLLAIVKSSKPKITKWIEEETDGESDRIAQLLTLNDLLNEATDTYDAIKAKGVGNVVVPDATARTSPAPKVTQQSSLIDFDAGGVVLSGNVATPVLAASAGPATVPTAQAAVAQTMTKQQSGADLLGDLSGLSFSTAPKSTFAPTSTMSSGGSTTTSSTANYGAIHLDSTNAAFWTGPSSGGSQRSGSPSVVGPMFSSGSASPQPVHSLTSSAAVTPSPGGLATAASANPTARALAMHPSPSGVSKPMMSSLSRSPSQTSQAISGPGLVAALTDLSSLGSPPTSSAAAVERVIFDKNGLRITMSAKQQPTGVIAAECYFSNAGTVAITQLAFQLAVRAGMQLQLDPASGNILPPKSVNSVMQTLRIANPAKAPLRLRFRLTFVCNGLSFSEQGEIANVF